jgi:hypothetical protein
MDVIARHVLCAEAIPILAVGIASSLSGHLAMTIFHQHRSLPRDPRKGLLWIWPSLR